MPLAVDHSDNRCEPSVPRGGHRRPTGACSLGGVQPGLLGKGGSLFEDGRKVFGQMLGKVASMFHGGGVMLKLMVQEAAEGPRDRGLPWFPSPAFALGAGPAAAPGPPP